MANWKDAFLAELEDISSKKHLKDYRAFVFWYIKAVEDLPDEDILDNITDGGRDAGIDAIIIDRTLKLIKIIQSKFSKPIGDKPFQKDELIKLNNISDYLNGKSDINKLREYVPKKLKPKLDEAVRLIKEDGYNPKLYFITTNKANPNSSLYNDLDMPIEIVTSHELESKYEGWIHGHTPDLGEVTLDYQESLNGPTDPPAYLVTLPSETLRKEYQKFKSKLFSRNVRVFYGESPKANKNMKKTLTEQPNKFWYFNNGITILAEKVTINKEDKKIKLKNPQIINGCQTVSTVGESRPMQSLLFAKIIEIADNISNQILIDGIIEANNRQTPVDERMLKSNHPLQIKLQRELKEKGFFYERKEGEYKSLRIDTKISKLKNVKNILLVKANLAIKRSPYLSESTEDDLFSTYFADIFIQDNSYIDYMIPYLLWQEIITIANNFNAKSRRRFQRLSAYHILKIIYDNCNDFKNISKANDIFNKLNGSDKTFNFNTRLVKDLFGICYDKYSKSDFKERDSGQRDFFKNKGTYQILCASINNHLKREMERLFA